MASTPTLSPERAAKRAAEKADTQLIGQIADRAVAFVKAHPEDFPDHGEWERTNIVIMLLAVRAGNPDLVIDFAKWLAFDDFNFLHDLFGIARHAKVPSGVLGGCFLPRCARGR